MGLPGTPGSSNRAGGAPAGADGRAAENPERRFNTDDISRQLLRVLQPLHVDSLSLHDGAGELQWLNEGAFGPDEHGVVMDALDVFTLDADRQDLQLKLDDDRTALCACARNAAGEVLGLSLAIIETPANEELLARLGAPRITSLTRRLAQLLLPDAPATAAPLAAPVPSAPTVPAAPVPPVTAAPVPAPVPRERRADPRAAQKIARLGSTIHARRYARLRAGGAARRYEVRRAPQASFAADLLLATQVIEQLHRSAERYRHAPVSFAIPLSAESVTRDGWLAALQPILARAGLPQQLIGFCLPPAAWDQAFEATTRFIAECEQQHCFVALDDFTLASHGLSLLQSSAVKCLKLDGTLIASVVKDKFAHATLAAIVQAARVLGLYCVAKRVATASEIKWLAAAGIEFADGVSRGLAVARTDARAAARHGDEL